MADNLFNPDPYYQQGGDMVRVGGMGFTIEVDAPAGRRISSMTLMKTGRADRSDRASTSSPAGPRSIRDRGPADLGRRGEPPPQAPDDRLRRQLRRSRSCGAGCEQRVARAPDAGAPATITTNSRSLHPGAVPDGVRADRRLPGIDFGRVDRLLSARRGGRPPRPTRSTPCWRMSTSISVSRSRGCSASCRRACCRSCRLISATSAACRSSR